MQLFGILFAILVIFVVVLRLASLSEKRCRSRLHAAALCPSRERSSYICAVC